MLWQILLAIGILVFGCFANYCAVKYHENVREKLRKEGKIKDDEYWDYWWWGM